ncbi:glycosyltransferase family 4 protein [Haliea sp.]|jgi:glycosyltransferase involved in cell wall biosynthesis|uniref:glycosyltransferase family 4 protein n=1 Tax=Haliea sp. TaxID=1932666 RepID=UPI000C58CDF1|nr:glycosyltransferase family 4 protein [Haliea sp.]MAD63939.1 hypothetical protein [Haliea sp.]MAY92300.1 hypothetical protein [Haliea sp.]MBK42224.1 hypothetical protein [Haliea sp.]MBP68321.1 hypothetical protein [Haliea sp.]
MRSSQKKIGYLTLNSVPHPSAASLNTLMMLDGIYSAGYDVSLYAPSKPWRPSTFAKRLTNNLPAGYRHIASINRCLQMSPYDKDRIAKRLVLKASSDGCIALYIRNREFVPHAVSKGIPFVYEVHSNPDGVDGELPFQNELYRRHVVLTNAARSAWIKRFPTLENKITVEADAIADVNALGIVLDYDIPPEKTALSGFKVGYFGGFTQGKGAGLVPAIAEDMPELEFHMYGGTVRDLKRVYPRRLPPNLNVGGRVRHEECLGMMLKMNALLLPNNYQQRMLNGDDIGETTSPIKLFEYMASKRPIIASPIPAVFDVLDKGDCIICQPDDVEGWVRAIEALRDSPELCCTLANRAFRKLDGHTFGSRFGRILSGVFD